MIGAAAPASHELKVGVDQPITQHERTSGPPQPATTIGSGTESCSSRHAPNAQGDVRGYQMDHTCIRRSGTLDPVLETGSTAAGRTDAGSPRRLRGPHPADGDYSARFELSDLDLATHPVDVLGNPTGHVHKVPRESPR